MSRRKKTSPIEDLLELVAMLPWWVGIALAIVSYTLLHRVATSEIVAVAQPGQMGVMVTHSIWKGLATAGQYALPLICLAAAVLSAWRRHERRTLVSDVTQSKAAGALDGMTWREFEMLVGEAFRLQGYQVTETGGGGADGGIDLALSRGGEKFLVQCKQWRAYKVGVDVVRELYGVMAAKGATGGFVVTSGRFTEEATTFASGRNVKLVDGPALHALIKQAKAARSRPVVGAVATAPAIPAAATAEADRSCPVCAKPMIRRTAKRGANAGGEFWGCSGYPACKGTRPIG